MKEGDPEWCVEFGRIVARKYVTRYGSVAKKFLLGHMDDIESHAIEAVWLAVRDYDPKKGTTLKSWCFGKGIWALLDWRRRQRGRTENHKKRLEATLTVNIGEHGELNATTLDGVEQIDLEDECRQKMRKAKLSREEMWLAKKRLEGWTHGEIGRRIGSSEAMAFVKVKEIKRKFQAIGLGPPRTGSRRSGRPSTGQKSPKRPMPQRIYALSFLQSDSFVPSL